MNNFSVKILLLLLLSILLTASSCNKNNMPDENKDWNVLEWIVDGERYKAECESGPLFGCDPVDCQYYNDSKSLNFRGGDLNKHGIKVYIRKDAKIGKYTNLKEYDEIFYGDGNLDPECGRYFIDTNFIFNLEIFEVDTSNKIIEGEFYFTGVSNCKDTSNIEDGYFKLTYRP